VAYRRDLFDMLWNAGEKTDPRPDDCCSGLTSAWIQRANDLPAKEVEYIGMALLKAHVDGRPGGLDGFGLLTKRNENGATSIDQALVEGCLPVLEFLDQICQKLDKPLSSLMNKSAIFHVHSPSVMAVHYGLMRAKWQTRKLVSFQEKMTEKEIEIQNEKILQRDRLEKITQKFTALAIKHCTWDMWRSILPDQSIPLTCLMETMGAAAALKSVRSCQNFSWSDHILISDECVRAVTKWRRVILKIDRKRRLNAKKIGPQGQNPETQDDQIPLNPAWLYNHPTLKLFTPILDQTILQVVQNFALNNHPLAHSKNPNDRVRIEKARITIFERTIKGPKKRAARRGPRLV
jgi:hypothetical protein